MWPWLTTNPPCISYSMVHHKEGLVVYAEGNTLKAAFIYKSSSMSSFSYCHLTGSRSQLTAQHARGGTYVVRCGCVCEAAVGASADSRA